MKTPSSSPDNHEVPIGRPLGSLLKSKHSVSELLLLALVLSSTCYASGQINSANGGRRSLLLSPLEVRQLRRFLDTLDDNFIPFEYANGNRNSQRTASSPLASYATKLRDKFDRAAVGSLVSNAISLARPGDGEGERDGDSNQLGWPTNVIAPIRTGTIPNVGESYDLEERAEVKECSEPWCDEALEEVSNYLEGKASQEKRKMKKELGVSRRASLPLTSEKISTVVAGKFAGMNCGGKQATGKSGETCESGPSGGRKFYDKSWTDYGRRRRR